jgi:hypothetical protein
MANLGVTSIVLAWIGTGCWGVCFWWMHRLSARQEAMLKKLQAVTKRIEKLSEVEHDLLREVHPTVEKIKESVDDVASAVGTDDSSSRGPAAKTSAG